MEEGQNRGSYYWIIAGVFLIALVGGFWYWQWSQEKSVFCPRRVAITENGDRVFTAGREGIRVFDGTGQVLSEIQTTLGETSIISAHNGNAYITDTLSGKVFVVASDQANPAVYTIFKEILVGGSPQFAIVDNIRNRLFVYRSADQNVAVINTESNEKIGEVVIGESVIGGIVDETSGKVYLLGSQKDGIFAIDEKSLAIEKRLDVGASAFISGVSIADSFDPAAQRLYISKGAGTIAVVSTAEAKVANEAKPANAPADIKEMTLSRQSGKLYTVSPREHAVFVFDTKDFSTKKLSLSPLLYPQKAAANEEDGLIYVYSQSKIPQISVLDMEGKELRSIPLGHELSDFRFSVKTKTLFAASQSGEFLMTLQGNGNPVFLDRSPMIAELKINNPVRIDIGDSKTLYVLNEYANTYLAFEPSALKLSGKLDLGGGPYTLIRFPTKPSDTRGGTYVANSAIQELWRLNRIQLGEVYTAAKIPFEGDIHHGTYLADLYKVYLSGRARNSIVAIDIEKDAIAKIIPVGENPVILGADQKQGRLFLSVGGKTFMVLDGKTDAIVSQIPVNIDTAGADRTREEFFSFYILGNDGRTLTMIDTKTNTIANRTTLAESFNAVSVLHWMKQVYLLNVAGDEILVLDATSLKKIATIAVKQPEMPSSERAIAVTVIEKANRVYITHESGKISVVDPNTKSTVAQIYIPGGGIPVSIDADPDNDRLYVANKWANNVMVFSLKDYSLLATIDQYGETTWVNK